MDYSYWQKQAADTPLFPDLVWSRPENARMRGKLLIIGGNQYGFSAPAEAYGSALKAGAGTTRVLLPQAVKKVAGALLPDLEYAPNTPSGSFGRQALSEFIEHAEWADGVLLAGDLGHNSETAILLESFMGEYAGQLTLVNDAIDYCLSEPSIIANRPETLLILSVSELQKLGTGLSFNTVFKSSMDLLHLIEGLHNFTEKHPFNIIVTHLEQIVVAVDGKITTTPLSTEKSLASINLAAAAAVWWLQNPDKPLEALTTAVTEK